MKKRLLCFFIMIVCLNLALSGCTTESNSSQNNNGQNSAIESSNSQKNNESNSVASNEPEINEFSDLRQCKLIGEGKSLANMDLTNEYDALIKSTFDTHTEWPSKDKLPKEFDPKEIIEIGKDPGLGIRDLHDQGITGKGVNVAIIDQPLLLEHEEYKDKIKKYTTIDCEGVRPQMHGPAVASILVGENCGVAPDASLYYWAQPSWKKDYMQRTTALNEIIEYNKDKPLNERIRVVSVSKGFCEDEANLALWKEKIKEAEENGIIVVHCSDEGNESFFGVGCGLYKDRDNPENYVICHFARGLSHMNVLYVPIDNRTTADPQGINDYTFWADGGISWGAPYLAGLIALGYQVNPNLKEEDIYKYLRETGTPFNGGYIINPKEFMEKINEMN